MQDQVGRFLQSIQSRRQFSENTVAAYRNDLTQFEKYMNRSGDGQGFSPLSEWCDLESAHLKSYLEYLGERDYALSTVARKAAAMKSFASWLKHEHVTNQDVGADIASPRVNKYVPKAISHEAVQRLVEAPTSDNNTRPDALRDRAMFEVLYATGMRVSEVVSLDVSDIEPETEGSIRIGRSDRVRTVPLSVGAIESLSHYMAESRPYMAQENTDALFVNHRGSRLTRQGFWLILKSYAEKLGMGDMTPHTLRHSFAVHALRRGLDIKEVQKQLGHVSLSTTRVYWQLAQQPDAPLDDA